MKKTVLLPLLLLSLITLGACESNTAKQWQRVFNDAARNAGGVAGD
jgi:CHASE1-domain containing sensor protein